jgi:hypothetical protein
MHVDDGGSGLNLFYFNHNTENCGTTFVVQVEKFEPFLTEIVPQKVLTGSDNCEEHCNSIHELEACSQDCRFAPFRRFLLAMIDAKRERASEQSPTTPAAKPVR